MRTKKTKTSHTPTPWYQDKDLITKDSNRQIVIAGAISVADAELIVNSVNSNKNLVDLAIRYFNDCESRIMDLTSQLGEPDIDTEDLQDQIQHWQASRCKAEDALESAGVTL